MTFPLSTTIEQSSEAKEAKIGSLDHVDGVRGASLVTETIVEVANTSRRCLWGLLPLS